MTATRNRLISQQLDLSQTVDPEQAYQMLPLQNQPTFLSPVLSPPSFDEVKSWMLKEKVRKAEKGQVMKSANDSITESAGTKTLTDSQHTITSDKSVSFSSRHTDDSYLAQQDETVEVCGTSDTKSKVIRRLDFDKEQPEQSDSGSSTQPLPAEKLNFKTELDRDASVLMPTRDISCVQGVTPKNAFGFKLSQQSSKGMQQNTHEFQHLTILSVEMYARTRANLRPDPEIDPICAIVYTIHEDSPGVDTEQITRTGIFLNDSKQQSPTKQQMSDTTPDMAARLYTDTALGLKNLPTPGDSKESLNAKVTVLKSEDELLNTFAKFVQCLDPDILVGYEIQMLSWGYILQRCHRKGLQLSSIISRLPNCGKQSRFQAEEDPYGADHMSEIHIAGRVVLNLWRLLRHEVILNLYTFENAIFHVMHERVPEYSFENLTKWFDQPGKRWRTLQYFVIRSVGNLRLMLHLDLISQTSEFARVFGIEFYHVLSRGSQYRVESMMLRTAKQKNYVAVSPSVQQRAQQRAPECIPLNLEPESRLYTDPVVVVDFQSLYPSIMIAYNYCFSTCLGRLESLAEADKGRFPLGCTSLEVPPSLLQKLAHDITICPNGVCFARQNVRKGILPQMVGDILQTRIMVKKSMKKYGDRRGLSKLLHARQLGLKLIANVTFGYTAATFSGRMPCVEIGDSIVRKSRETLERAIDLVNSTKKWGARVVYGDTDSMFILLQGRSKEEAFKIGQEIADEVTAANPKPIKLKFEKVYQPCVLQTKKRYVGYMYESVDQAEPVFDAKGIETVRRDNCPVVSKVLEKSLHVLFKTYDVSAVKQYVQEQCRKLLEDRCSLQDCIFAKEYRGQKGYRPTACVPALEIARRRLQVDKRAEPRVGERVPYVIVYGSPGLPLIKLVREPHEVLNDPQLRINAVYYICKQILPPLDRVMSLLGIDVFVWYAQLPKIQSQMSASSTLPISKKGTISQFFASTACLVCGNQTEVEVCVECRKNPQVSAYLLSVQARHHEKRFNELSMVCNQCMRYSDHDQPCMSTSCPIMFARERSKRYMSQETHTRTKQILDF